MTTSRQSVCLSMIVKNEAHVIERCLDSVRPLIDHWVVVDTGSTDGTQEVVRRCMADLPGQLLERPWVDFAHNRTEALEAARDKAPYSFIIDADEVLIVESDFILPSLDADGYQMKLRSGNLTYWRTLLVANRLPWRYVGVLHEKLDCEVKHETTKLRGVLIRCYREGARSRDPLIYKKDALTLEQALLEEPDNRRYVFYLAQSYSACGDLELAIRHYQRRAEMGGWVEEIWYAVYQIAMLRHRRGDPWPDVLAAYLRAYEAHPLRAEPLFQIGMHYMDASEFRSGCFFLGAAARMPVPADDILFIDHDLYEHRALIEYARCAHRVGDHDEAIRTNDQLLARTGLDPQLRKQITTARASAILYRFTDAPLLAHLVSDLSFEPLFIDLPPGYNAFNPSIAADMDGSFKILIRASNYRLLADAGYYVNDGDGILRTINFIGSRDSAGIVSRFHQIVDVTDPKLRFNCRATGFEDGRLVYVHDQWFASATTCDHNQDGWSQMALLRLDCDRFVDLTILSELEARRHEKNWMPVVIDDVLHFIYSCSPIILLRYDQRNQRLFEISRKGTTDHANGFRGGSQLIKDDDGWLCIIHEITYQSDDRRFYTHRLVHFSNDLNIVGCSHPFVFRTRGVEYCTGLARDGDRLLATFGVEDREAWLSSFDLAQARSLILPVAEIECGISPWHCAPESGGGWRPSV